MYNQENIIIFEIQAALAVRGFAIRGFDYSVFGTLFSSFMDYHKFITLYVSTYYLTISFTVPIVSIHIIFYLIITSCLRGNWLVIVRLDFTI